MKLITPHLVKFALIALFLTIGFRFVLSYGITNQIFTIIYLSVLVYFSSMFINGYINGKNESNYLPILDIGFRYHLITFIVYNLVTEVFYRLHLQSMVETLNDSHRTILYWLPFLIIHFIIYLFTKKNTIKGLDKDDIFE